MRTLLIALSFFCLLNNLLFAQTVDPNRRTDWSLTGVEGGIPCWENEVDFLSNGGVADGSTDNTAALQALINTYAGTSTVIYLDAGEYRFDSYLSIPRAGKLVIRGAGSNLTKLIFNSSNLNSKGDFEIVSGYNDNVATVVSEVIVGDNSVIVNDASNYKEGDWLEIQKENDATEMYTSPDWDVDWAANSVGQIAKVVRVNGNTITIDRPFRSEYELSLNPSISKVNMTEYVGFENFYMENLVNGDHYDFHFKRTANCWVSGVHANMTSKMFAYITNSCRQEVKGCYFEDSFDHGGGGHGYGVVHGTHTSDCIAENNVFRRLRHSLMSKQGCNGNVMAYNYSFEYHADFDGIPTDISLHGHWPYMNLYEGNIMNHGGSGDYWGPSGPGNTFFRNRFKEQNLYMNDASHDQNVVGNELTIEKLLVSPSVQGTYIHGNNDVGMVTWDDFSGRNNLINSYYLSSKPAWWGSESWPSIGPEFVLGSGTNPAFDRVSASNGDENQYVVAFDCSKPICKTPFLGNDQNICGQNSITLNTGVPVDGISTFEWFLNDEPQGVVTSEDNMISISQPGTWKVKLDSLGLCSSEDVIEISAVIDGVDLGLDVELCDELSKGIDAGDYNENYTYNWTLDNQAVGTDTSYFEVKTEGDLILTITATGCPIFTDKVTVESLLPTVQGDFLCSEGLAELSATGFGTLNWFDFEGELLNSGTTYSPSIEESTTYYVEDEITNQYTAGRVEMDQLWGGADYEERKIQFTLEVPVKIDAVTVYSSGNQTVHVRILALDNSEVLHDVSSDIGSGVQEVLLGISLEPGTYHMDAFGTTGVLKYENENSNPQVDYSAYAVPGIISFNSVPDFESTSVLRWRYFYNWKITNISACKSVPVEAVVDPGSPECIISDVIKDYENNELKIYPNPTTGKVHLPEEKQYSVANILGELIQKSYADVIDFSNHPNGVYLIRIDDTVHKIIKR